MAGQCRTGKPRQDSQDRTVSTEHPGQDIQDWTSRTGQPGQGRTVKKGQNSYNKIAGTGQLDRAVGIALPGQDRDDRIER